MRYLIALILVLGFMCSASYANEIGIGVTKDVNGGYEITTPVMMDAQSQLPFLPKAYLKISQVFSAPRGEFISSLKSANHSRLDGVIGSGITLLGGNLEYEIGFTYWQAGNSQGIPEGYEGNNAVRYMFRW